MPRIVDAEQRRRELTEAVWRVIRRDGVAAASVRAVAREAGTSMGALRHWFATQDELLHFAMTLVVQRARARAVVADAAGGTLVDRLLRVLEETLPLDDDRRAEAEVWLALTARALVDPALAELRDRSADELHGFCTEAVRVLVAEGVAPAGLDVELEGERLYAVVDGLAVHALTRPSVLPPDRARAVLAAHLAALGDRS
ncbi:TetR family transcriptional regulator C-terminal domain-containing protein [Geodermatophilus sp. DSM 44513]|uniref:TetR family transcriptional regulator C-terminal domain-containing protein n=1 Tax=Geodermatophilus sp. DSM 44513 TaxID=1528104 RepID=UPI001412671B|nr:TetR family transcriptional regulator C-terminal domain-containing protein [Geodermatophilus sp. DSM 44513]WNV75562.1 TetR family transcriptional regulator C-terminal domain-containing protein [Geodermatophilus sp. DSM 44513]